jgi:hypothetical protein
VTAATLPAPVDTSSDTDDDLTHLTCCDHDRCLCGLDASGWDDLGPTTLSADTCSMCALVWESGGPCGSDCPRRRR